MVRSLFWPEVEGTYAGYVCWRGFVSESECPPALVDFVGNRFTLFQVRRQLRRARRCRGIYKLFVGLLQYGALTSDKR